MQVTEILTDHTGMALDLTGTADYPIRFYLDIMDQFDRAGIRWHWHPELEFNVITRGSIEYYVENAHYTLSAGQGILKNANILHMAQPARHTPDAEMFSVIMDAAFIAPVQSLIYRNYVAPLLGSRGLHSLLLSPDLPWQREILDALRQAYALSQTETGAHELHIHRLMCQVWQALAEHAQDLPRQDLTAAQRTDQVRVKEMISYLQAHFAEKVTLDQVAQAANVSRNTCLTCFRRVLDLSPMEYLANQRLDHARHLLLTTHLPIAQVAEACGLPDTSYFGKLFRKKTGLSPTQYRRRQPPEKKP